MTMVLGGLQKNSLIDFPGTVACVVFTSGCNFCCPYCHNPDLARGEDTGAGITETGLFAFLEKRKGLLDGVVITGGEPTLQKDLEEFLSSRSGVWGTGSSWTPMEVVPGW